MNFIAVFIFFSSCVPPHNRDLNVRSLSALSKFQGKTFRVQSLPFFINGLQLQFQYIVKEDIYAEKPKESVLVLDKKLVDLKRNLVVLDLPIQQDISPTLNLADIDKAKYSPEDFDDVNFDGYKDIREVCEPCSGSLGNVEEIYLFDHRAKKFTRWQSVMGINVEIDKKNKTVQCYTKRGGGGEFGHQEIKFIGRGIELYEKNIYCHLVDEKKRLFKVVYNKYVGKKLKAHKTRMITRSFEESLDPWPIINDIEK